MDHKKASSPNIPYLSPNWIWRFSSSINDKGNSTACPNIDGDNYEYKFGWASLALSYTSLPTVIVSSG